MFTKSFWDRLGISLSGLCVVHCLFFPVMIVLLPLWPVADTIHFWMHPILFLLIAPAVYYVVRDSDIPDHIPQLLFIGLTVIALAWGLHGEIGLWAESAITITGSIFLIAGHWMNYKNHYLRACSGLRNPNLK